MNWPDKQPKCAKAFSAEIRKSDVAPEVGLPWQNG
jgi:hypothetical protein